MLQKECTWKYSQILTKKEFCKLLKFETTDNYQSNVLAAFQKTKVP